MKQMMEKTLQMQLKIHANLYELEMNVNVS